MQELMMSLLVWIGANSAIVYEGGHAPELRMVPQQELERRFRRRGAEHPTIGGGIGLTAFYDFDENRIYVADSVDHGTVEGKAVLVHELVHYLQYRNGHDREVMCMRQLERPAYEIQADYLAMHGAEPEFDDMTVHIRSLCWIL